MKTYSKRKRYTPEKYIEGILKQNRNILSQSITLIESHLESDRALAEKIIERLLPYTGNSKRIGITGSTGVGKSTFIETFGQLLTHQNQKVAILAIDPSSPKSGGSIMGDKTRMQKLSQNPNVFIRPSPAGRDIGGITQKSRECMLLCEAAGFDVILIETTGAGQSEIAVKDMVDCFLLLMIGGAGDELQGLKKGIMELADIIAITKSDGENIERNLQLQTRLESITPLFQPNTPEWPTKVLTCSAMTNKNIDTIWELLQNYFNTVEKNGWLHTNRKQQQLSWMYSTIKTGLERRFYGNHNIKNLLPQITEQVSNSKISAYQAAKALLDTFC